MAPHAPFPRLARVPLRFRHSIRSQPLSFRPRARQTQAPRRNASSSTTPPPPPPREAAILPAGLKTLLYTTATLATAYAGYLYATDTRASLLHTYLVPPLLRLLVPDAEKAHHLGTSLLEISYSLGLHPRDRSPETGDLAVRVFSNRQISNPIGISAGLDKDARVPDALFALGAAVVEVGGITPVPQEGNPKPRVFRVAALRGMVNRYGLNSEGADAVARRLRARLRAFARSLGLSEAEVLAGAAGVPVGSLRAGGLLCVQVAKAKGTDETDTRAVAGDYASCVDKLGPYADVIVVNVSSPNTPGLRDLQASGPLAEILGATVEAARRAARRCGRRDAPRVMVKVSPDEDSDAQVDGVVRAVWASGVDGVIVGNTTKRRDVVPVTAAGEPSVPLSQRDLAALHETGGYSGPAMFDRTVALVGRYRKALDESGFAKGGASESESGEGQGQGAAEQKTIFATGGITNGAQALQVLNAGASVAMVYTGLVYGGPGTVTRMKGEMRRELLQQ